MNWITQGKVKAAAATEEKAKKCSEHHWRQLWNCTHEELKRKVAQYPLAPHIMISPKFCAFCIRHDYITCLQNGKCPLKDCREYGYDEAADAFVKWSNDKTLANFKEFQKKAKIMWRKIKNLKV
jgi:hypothetical protein